MNEQFLKLPAEKQLAIVNAAMEVFATNDYKKASTDVIAAKAGISKGSLFYYFHNKKELYLYLYSYVAQVMKDQIVDDEFWKITDFFEVLRYVAGKKVKILSRNPYITEFAMKSFYSEKEDVSEDLQKVNTDSVRKNFGLFMTHVDKTKFKEGTEPFKVYKMLLWMAMGYLYELRTLKVPLDVTELMKEFDGWMIMLRKMVYKEEYQDGDN